MSTTTRTPVTAEQFEILRKIGQAADQLRRLSASLEATGSKTIEELAAGRRIWGLSHQTPKDFWAAEAAMNALLDVATCTFGAELEALVGFAVAHGDRDLYSVTDREATS